MYQNQNLIKTSRNYTIYYQLYVKEPDFQHFLGNALSTLAFTGVQNSGATLAFTGVQNSGGSDININNDNDMKKEYNSRVADPLPGRTIKVDFKLCFEYCETCKILGITTDDQYCITCLEPYRYDYFNYFDDYPSNCVPEGYFNDKETGKLVKCENRNRKISKM